MVQEILGKERLLSNDVRFRFGKHRFYGRALFASTRYGLDDIYLVFSPYGVSRFGLCFYGEYIILTGIYRRDNVTGKIIYYRENYYSPRNPRTELQQANRKKFSNGVSSWKHLTNEEKCEYNKRGNLRHMSGFNLFMREYLLSH